MSITSLFFAVNLLGWLLGECQPTTLSSKHDEVFLLQLTSRQSKKSGQSSLLEKSDLLEKADLAEESRPAHSDDPNFDWQGIAKDYGYSPQSDVDWRSQLGGTGSGPFQQFGAAGAVPQAAAPEGGSYNPTGDSSWTSYMGGTGAGPFQPRGGAPLPAEGAPAAAPPGAPPGVGLDATSSQYISNDWTSMVGGTGAGPFAAGSSSPSNPKAESPWLPPGAGGSEWQSFMGGTGAGPAGLIAGTGAAPTAAAPPPAQAAPPGDLASTGSEAMTSGTGGAPPGIGMSSDWMSQIGGTGAGPFAGTGSGPFGGAEGAPSWLPPGAQDGTWHQYYKGTGKGPFEAGGTPLSAPAADALGSAAAAASAAATGQPAAPDAPAAPMTLDQLVAAPPAAASPWTPPGSMDESWKQFYKGTGDTASVLAGFGGPPAAPAAPAAAAAPPLLGGLGQELANTVALPTQTPAVAAPMPYVDLKANTPRPAKELVMPQLQRPAELERVLTSMGSVAEEGPAAPDSKAPKAAVAAGPEGPSEAEDGDDDDDDDDEDEEDEKDGPSAADDWRKYVGGGESGPIAPPSLLQGGIKTEWQGDWQEDWQENQKEKAKKTKQKAKRQALRVARSKENTVKAVTKVLHSTNQEIIKAVAQAAAAVAAPPSGDWAMMAKEQGYTDRYLEGDTAWRANIGGTGSGPWNIGNRPEEAKAMVKDTTGIVYGTNYVPPASIAADTNWHNYIGGTGSSVYVPTAAPGEQEAPPPVQFNSDASTDLMSHATDMAVDFLHALAPVKASGNLAGVKRTGKQMVQKMKGSLQQHGASMAAAAMRANLGSGFYSPSEAGQLHGPGAEAALLMPMAEAGQPGDLTSTSSTAMATAAIGTATQPQFLPQAKAIYTPPQFQIQPGKIDPASQAGKQLQVPVQPPLPPVQGQLQMQPANTVLTPADLTSTRITAEAAARKAASDARGLVSPAEIGESWGKYVGGTGGGAYVGSEAAPSQVVQVPTEHPPEMDSSIWGRYVGGTGGGTYATEAVDVTIKPMEQTSWEQYVGGTGSGPYGPWSR